MRRLVVTVLGIALLLGLAARAEAKVVRYLSQHPLPRKIGRGFCHIDVPHVHDFGPSDPRLYRDVDGQLYFVGDPSPFDYDGPRYSFYGAHPVVEANVNVNVQLDHPVYCYLRGPHYHWYQPPPEAQFQFRGGAYWYTGNYEPIYYQERPRYVTVNEAYQPITYTRPVVDVTVAPPTFHGEIVAGLPGMPVGRAVVSAPGISAGITVAAPPPPQVHIGVGIPAPVVIGVPPPIFIGAPPVVVHERREVYIREHEHHDNGRHRGWDRERHQDRGGGWRAPPPQQQPQPQRAGGGWRGAPPPPPPQQQRHQAPAPPPGGGWRGAPPQQHNNDNGNNKPRRDQGWRR